MSELYTIMKNIIDIYHSGLITFINSLNSKTHITDVGIFFDITRRDKHIAERMVERNIDFLKMIPDIKHILNERLCEIVYAIYSGHKDIVVKSQFGNMVFVVNRVENRCGYVIKIVTMTQPNMKHNQSFIID